MAEKVSVIMPVYGGEKYLAAAIESALGQTHHDLELIIVNDCSPDHSDDIVHGYLSDPRVRYLRNPRNRGVAASRNHALQHATGDYIAFLDQDDVWLPNKLTIQLAALRSHPELGLLHSYLARIDADGILLPEYQNLDKSHFDNPEAAVETGFVFNELFVSNDIQPLTSIIPRHVLEDVGHFNEALPGVDDYELWLRIARHYPIGRVQTVLGYWRKHETQQSSQGYKMLLLRLKAINSVIEKDPTAVKLLNKRDHVERMHALNLSAANHYLYNVHDYRRARGHFIEVIRLKPLDVSSLAKLAYCAMPEKTRTACRSIKNKLGSGFH